MAFYKVQQMKQNGRYYPVAVLVAKPAGIDEVAEQIAESSTVSKADIAAVLTALPAVMARIMNSGRSVRLDNIGTFRYTINARKGGQETEKKVTASDIQGTRIRFLPETAYKTGTGATTRTLVGSNISWDKWTGATVPDDTTPDDGGSEGTGGSSGSDGNTDDNPLG